MINWSKLEPMSGIATNWSQGLTTNFSYSDHDVILDSHRFPLCSQMALCYISVIENNKEINIHINLHWYCLGRHNSDLDQTWWACTSALCGPFYWFSVLSWYDTDQLGWLHYYRIVLTSTGRHCLLNKISSLPVNYKVNQRRGKPDAPTAVPEIKSRTYCTLDCL